MSFSSTLRSIFLLLLSAWLLVEGRSEVAASAQSSPSKEDLVAAGQRALEAALGTGELKDQLHDLEDTFRRAVGSGANSLLAQATASAGAEPEGRKVPAQVPTPAAAPVNPASPPAAPARTPSEPDTAPKRAPAAEPTPTPSAQLITEQDRIHPVIEPPLPEGDFGPALADADPLADAETPLPSADGRDALPPISPEVPLSGADLSATPTGGAVVGLIRKLVERGIIPEEDAKAMIAQARAEAETQQIQMQADAIAVAEVAAAQVVAEQQAAAATRSPLQDARDAMRVSYIPAPVRMQLKDEIKSELAASGVGSGPYRLPPGWPDWVTKIKPSGEIRVRFEGDLYPEGNDNTGAFPNFNAINTGAPFDVTGTEFAPQWNVDQHRTRFRLLARFGLGIDLGDNFSAGLRIGTGDNNSPVSANQSMGLANQAQGGQFSDYALWLERAYIRYDLGGGEDSGAFTFWTGRFDNPFFSTPLIFDEDLGFDGFAVRLAYNYRNSIMPSVVAGAFPVFNTDLNFSSNRPEKFPSYDKYLFAVQTGTQINFSRHWNGKIAAAYYNFYNVEGRLSTPFVPLSPDDAGDTDNSRPSFAQKGNTYMALRDILPDPSNDFGAINQWQYFGLATPFENFVLTGEVNYDGFEPVRVSVVGEFAQNLAYNSGQINEVAVNNRGAVIADDPDIDTSSIGAYEGEAYAWLLDLVVGHAELDKAGAWQMSLGYRYIGSDAVVDGFNDSDFGLGGTNMKGFTAAGRLALNPNVYLGVRWFGAESIAGPQFDMNILQFDIGAKF